MVVQTLGPAYLQAIYILQGERGESRIQSAFFEVQFDIRPRESIDYNVFERFVIVPIQSIWSPRLVDDSVQPGISHVQHEPHANGEI